MLSMSGSPLRTRWVWRHRDGRHGGPGCSCRWWLEWTLLRSWFVRAQVGVPSKQQRLEGNKKTREQQHERSKTDQDLTTLSEALALRCGSVNPAAEMACTPNAELGYSHARGAVLSLRHGVRHGYCIENVFVVGSGRCVLRLESLQVSAS